MTALSSRLRAAAEAERLADWVRVSHLDYTVRWRKGDEVLMVLRRGPLGWGSFEALNGFWCGEMLSASAGLKREAAIRAGLRALAEREEAR